MDADKTGAAVALDSHARGGEHHAPARAHLLLHPVPVAVLSSVLAGVAFASHFPGGEAVIAAFVAAVLVVLAATDLERRIIPNRVVLPATAIVLAAHAALSPGQLPEVVLAAIGAGIVFLIPNLINPSLMGMGDVKLAVLLGAALGGAVMSALLIGCLAVFPVAVGKLIRGGRAARKSTLPFGPFLALGGLVILIVPHLAGAG